MSVEEVLDRFGAVPSVTQEDDSEVTEEGQDNQSSNPSYPGYPETYTGEDFRSEAPSSLGSSEADHQTQLGDQPELGHEEVTIVEEVARRYGWTLEAVRAAFGSSWPEVASSPKALEQILRNAFPHPSLEAERRCPHTGPIPDPTGDPEEPVVCPECGEVLAGPAVPIQSEPEVPDCCRYCGDYDFWTDKWGVNRCRRCRPPLED